MRLGGEPAYLVGAAGGREFAGDLQLTAARNVEKSLFRVEPQAAKAEFGMLSARYLSVNPLNQGTVCYLGKVMKTILGGLGIIPALIWFFGSPVGALVAQDSEAKPALALRTELAGVSLELAEVELKLAEEFNREVESVLLANVPKEDRESYIRNRQLPQVIVERLRSNVELARQQREQANSPSTGDVEKLRKKYAEEKIRLAEIQLATMHKHKEKGLPVKDGEIRRLELKLRQAQLNRKLLDSPENLLEIVDSLQRQVDRLNEELIRHDQRLSAVEDGDK